MSTRHSFHRYVSPAGLMRVACLTTATALLLTSCAEPEPAAPEPAQETQVYLPLPDGSSIEKAGSVAPEEVITTGLLGSLRPDERTPEERVPEIVANLSQYYHLQPGDLIYTGTPEGVGPVQPGDVITGRIDGVGEIALTIGQPE